MLIYRDARVEKEECNFGCEHHVTYNEITIVEEVARVKKDLWYGPIRCGIGYDTFYRGLAGELYLRESDWSGASHILIDSENRFWMTRPQGFEVNKNLTGELIIPEWKRAKNGHS